MFGGRTEISEEKDAHGSPNERGLKIFQLLRESEQKHLSMNLLCSLTKKQK